MTKRMTTCAVQDNKWARLHSSFIISGHDEDFNFVECYQLLIKANPSTSSSLVPSIKIIDFLKILFILFYHLLLKNTHGTSRQ